MIVSPELIRFEAKSFYACPIAGLQIEGNSIVLGGLLLVKFNRAEWEMVERRYIFKDWHPDFYNVNPVFVYQPLDDASNDQEAIEEVNTKVSRLISAFRLHRHGNVLDPIYTVRFKVKENIFSREVGPYRTEYLAYPINNLLYELKNGEKDSVNRICNILAEIDKTSGSDFINDVINNFNLSFLPSLNSFFKLSILFTGFEMLYGRLNSGIGHNSTLYNRSLAIITATHGALPEEDPWYLFYTKQINDLRNTIHHNKKNDFPDTLDQAAVYLQESIRLGISVLMRLYRLNADGRYQAITTDHNKSYTPKEVLNLSLDKLFNGDDSLWEKILSN